ncbi:amidase [Polaromonas sp. YR568]|uniref:amidase n=1 Tax=Polaromonas sp. YR568 TaxID=1855301 RepID=UPI0008F1F3F8|nr:amidase [Polaromonas sp. YR568]SFU61905.1 amidase [Polaromonas sp. YR568]
MGTALLHPGLNGAFLTEGFGDSPAVVATSSRLQGLSLAAKDVFDVAGSRTGAGNPLWLSQQTAARTTALPIRLLLEAGAQWVGRTVTDELAYSVLGINAHYGTPENPRSPGRIPGGSSSGSAVAVAGGHADIAIGSDCGGSMRLPASFCGVWGLRPTHGRIAKNGGFSLAPSFDTVGWFARRGEHMAEVFSLLAHAEMPVPARTSLIVVDDALALCEPALRGRFLALIQRIEKIRPIKSLPVGTLPLAAWLQAHRTLQAAEIWQQHGPWVSQHGDTLGADVRRRFDMASRITPAQVTAAQQVRVTANVQITSLLGSECACFLWPTAPCIAPPVTSSPEDFEAMRVRAQSLLGVAGLAGLPEISFPWTQFDGAPAGLSLIGARGADATVIAGAMALDEHLQTL